jgi:putative endonuclease
MTQRTLSLGRWGETIAAAHLLRQGYTILAQNARTAYGELDLVVGDPRNDPAEIVFVEVKTRASTSLGPPEISITERKRAHLLAAAQAYLLAHPDLPQNWRVDVVAVFGAPGRGEPELVHFENALTAN